MFCSSGRKLRPFAEEWQGSVPKRESSQLMSSSESVEPCGIEASSFVLVPSGTEGEAVLRSWSEAVRESERVSERVCLCVCLCV